MSGVRVDNENWSTNRQKTEPTSKDVLASIFGRFWLDFGKALGAKTDPKSINKPIEKTTSKTELFSVQIFQLFLYR